MMQTNPVVRELVQSFVLRVTELVSGEARRSAAERLQRMFGEVGTIRGTAPKPIRKGGRPSQNVLNGRYMGRLRSFSGTERDRIKKERADKGIGAALKLMDRLSRT
jgi:hypothetical protein